jgi:hypothetical protein
MSQYSIVIFMTNVVRVMVVDFTGARYQMPVPGNKDECVGLRPARFSFDAVWSPRSPAVHASTKSNARSAIRISWHRGLGTSYLNGTYFGSCAVSLAIALSCFATTCLNESRSFCSCPTSFLNPLISFAASFNAWAVAASTRGFPHPTKRTADPTAIVRNFRIAWHWRRKDLLVRAPKW